MLRNVALFACVVIGVAGVRAIGARGQSQAGTPAAASIVGRVIDGDSGKPVQEAEVSLGPPPRFLPPGVRMQDMPRQPPPSTILTDQNGQFSFPNLSPGSYTLSARKAGYLVGFNGATEPLTGNPNVDVQAGKDATNITVRLWRQSVIAGSVKTSSGQPVTGAAVIAWRIVRDRGGLSLQRAVALDGRLDDRGEYRLANISPGRYVLCLQHLTSAHPVLELLDAAPEACEVFFPNGTLPTEATMITVGTGEERAADIEVPKAIRSVPVSGRVVGISKIPRNTRVRLVLANGSSDIPAGFQVAAVDLGADGTFSFTSVRPGAYVVRGLAIPPTQATASPTLEMNQPPIGRLPGPAGRPDTRTPIRPLPDEQALSFEQRLDVGDQPVRDLVVQAQPGSTVSGRVVLDPQLVLTGTELEAIPIFAGQVGVEGWNLDGLPMGRIEADGRFRSAPLPPGRFMVVPFNQGDWFAESEMLGGHDVMGEGFDVAGRDITDVVVTLTRQRATGTGVVRDSSGKLRPDASVYAFPAEERNWPFGQMSVPRPNSVGEYRQTFSAGAYVLVASVDPLSGYNRCCDSDFLRALLPHGTKVTLARGETKSVNLILQDSVKR